ncbi:unnamed protein product, partial [Pocillopora meandrina]
DCRILEFKPDLKDFSLQGFVIKSFEVQKESDCKARCFQEHNCVSLNIGPSGNNGAYLCELSDSDHEMHSEALKPRDGFTYHSTEVIIPRSFFPELPNSTPNEPKTSTNPIESSSSLETLPKTISTKPTGNTIKNYFAYPTFSKLLSDNKILLDLYDECRTIIFQTPIHNKVIEGNVIRTEEVSHQGSCNEMCYMEPSCVSMNFGPKVGGNFTCELNQDHSSEGDQSPPVPQRKKGHIYLAIENPCSSNPCSNNGTCQAGYTDKGFRCKCPSGFTGAHCNEACSFDFEDGISAWEMTGTAFIYQPTFGDNPVARRRESANQQGDWWVGGAEKRPSESDPAGKLYGDSPKGTLISPCFRIAGRDISFLIGGGCSISDIRAELIVDNQVVRTETGNCKETMYRKSWDVKEFIGQYAQVRLVDERDRVWGHINFDDLKGDIICPHYSDENN